MSELPPESEDVGMPATDRARDRPSVLRGPSARTYLLMLLGWFVLDHGDRVWTQTLIGALGLVGFEEKTARRALARSQAAGWLVPERSGRRVRWHLTAEGRRFLLEGRTRLFAAGPERDWDGEWLVLVATIPERHRDLRHQLRTSLGWAGFGSLGPGMWISPHPSRAEEARKVLDSLGTAVRGTLLRAHLDDPGERHELVAQTWDVSELAARYDDFVKRFAAVELGSPAEAVAELAHLLYAWRRLVLLDPGLPPALLPPDWSGEQARRLLLDRSARWGHLAQAWWQEREAESDQG